MRNVLFLDTPDIALYRDLDLVFRARQKQSASGRWEGTLKFRHGDRLLAGAQKFQPRDMDKGGDEEGCIKFEEDVKAVISGAAPHFWALFSRSATVKLDALPVRLGDVFDNYEKLPRALKKIGVAEPVVPVKDLQIVEQVFKGATLSLASEIAAECALIVWWKKDDPKIPIAVEFSFRFDLRRGQAKAAIAEAAWSVMASLYRLKWIDPDGPTKTAIAYGASEV